MLQLWADYISTVQVEGEVQGDEQTVQKLLQQIDKGPRHAHVVKLEKKELEPQEGEDQFLVMRTAESMFHSGA
jgi:acylphosphatase